MLRCRLLCLCRLLQQLKLGKRRAQSLLCRRDDVELAATLLLRQSSLPRPLRPSRR